MTGLTRLTWRQLAPDDPLTTSRSVTPWAHGYIAVARELAPDDAGPSQVSVSPDGVTWTRLPAGTFGPTSAVISVAATRDGVVALTLQLEGTCDEPPDVLECHQLSGPLQSWTSADGTAWTAHPVTGVALPGEMSGNEDDHPVLEQATAPLLIVRSEGRWPAASDDGVTWDHLGAGDLPRGWRAAGATAFAGGYVGIGSAAGASTVVSSTDGRHWTATALRPKCGNPDLSRSMLEPLAAGADGLVAQGSRYEESGIVRWLWCASGGGRAWQPLDSFPPLGASKMKDECRDVCPNGILVADGQRFLAYRGIGTPAAWASLDGRAWDRLAVAGTPPTGWVDPTYPFTMNLLPIGLLAQNGSNDSAWLGVLEP